jgi:hypothetical protein
MKMNKTTTTLAALSVAMVALISGCNKNEWSGNNSANPASMSNKGYQTEMISSVPLGTAASFAVLGGSTVTNAGESLITGNLGVSPGTAITGFQDINRIEGPGTVTYGLGIVEGTIYAGGPVAAQAHNDAAIAYGYLVSQVPTTQYPDIVYQLDGLTLTPGVYNFPSSANLLVNGTLTLDFQGNSDALFIFQVGSTLVTMAGSDIVAINTGTPTCLGSNVFWAVGSSATIDGDSFIGTVIANTSITMTYGSNVSGRMLALYGEVTLIADTISVCGTLSGSTHVKPAGDFITGGGWINDKATFGVSGGIKHNKFWGQLLYNDHNGVQVKSTEVTNYTVIDEVTRQIDGLAKINGEGSFAYTVVVVDNGEPGINDIFSIVLSNGYTASGTLNGGNIQLHVKK